jgi:MOSC domain-containing protein YiiM
VASVVSVNVGQLHDVPWRGSVVATGIFKAPVAGRVPVRGVNVGGDVQADLRYHGGPTKAVYAYAAEDYAWWSDELGRDVGAGTFGENLTVQGLDVGGAVLGERWRVGTALLAVTEPRIPCFKLGIRMGDQRFVRRFAQALRPGAYLRIVEEGDVAAGDEVTIVDRPDHEVTVTTVMRAYRGDESLLPALRAVPDLSPGWASWLARQPASSL